MIWIAHITFGACIVAIMIFWARTNDGRSALYGLLVLGAISTALVLEMEDLLIVEALNRVLVEFYEVGGAAVIVVLTWATITTFIRERRRTR